MNGKRDGAARVAPQPRYKRNFIDGCNDQGIITTAAIHLHKGPAQSHKAVSKLRMARHQTIGIAKVTQIPKLLYAEFLSGGNAVLNLTKIILMWLFFYNAPANAFAHRSNTSSG